MNSVFLILTYFKIFKITIIIIGIKRNIHFRLLNFKFKNILIEKLKSKKAKLKY